MLRFELAVEGRTGMRKLEEEADEGGFCDPERENAGCCWCWES